MKKKIDLPPYEKMMWPAILALKEMGGSASNQELLDKVIAIMQIPEDKQNILHNNGPNTEVNYRLAWAKTYLGKVNALTNSTRGVWNLTQSGRALTEEDVAKIPAQVREPYKKAIPKTKNEEQVNLDVDEGVAWKDALLDILKNMPPDAFERLSQLVLRESGFVKVEVTGGPHDEGIDGTGILRINLISFHVRFQCKRYKETVGPDAVQKFRGAIPAGVDKGLLITTARFTPAAQKEATKPGHISIDLIDGESLCGLLKDLKLGVETKMVEEVSVISDFFSKV